MKALNDVTVHHFWMAEYKVLEFAALYMKVNLVTPEDKTEKCGQLKTNGNEFYTEQDAVLTTQNPPA